MIGDSILMKISTANNLELIEMSNAITRRQQDIQAQTTEAAARMFREAFSFMSENNIGLNALDLLEGHYNPSTVVVRVNSFPSKEFNGVIYLEESERHSDEDDEDE